MFLRVRGKGASPENSQAAVMHLRGFRHVNVGPPAGSYTLLSCTADSKSCVPAMRPFRSAHFAMGVQAKAVVQAQQRYDSEDAASAKDTNADIAAEEERPMVWKETWNAYDIVYDEVPLLPASYDLTNAQLKALAATTEQSALHSLAALPADYCLPEKWTGNQKAVVCTHYYANQALTAEALTARGVDTRKKATEGSHASQRPALVVLDLSHVPAAEAHVKLAVELAWLAGFASVQPDLPLARARRVLIRLPYDAVPSAANLQQLHNVAEDATEASWPAAVLAMYDFLGQHLALTHCGTTHWAQLSLHALPAPPVLFIGKDTETLSTTGQRLLAEVHAEEEVSQTPVDKTSHQSTSQVLYFIGDHRLSNDGLTEAELATQVRALAETWQAEVQVVKVPLKALIDGGEEPWDQYTQQERTRLNFCPCCGHCAGHDH